MRAGLLLAPALVLILAGCQGAQLSGRDLKPADLLLRTDETLSPPNQLSASQVDQDVSLLKYALREGYGGRKYVPPTGARVRLKRLNLYGKRKLAHCTQKNFSFSLDGDGLFLI